MFFITDNDAIVSIIIEKQTLLVSCILDNQI